MADLAAVPVSTDLRWAAVAWAPYSRRSEMFARALGGPLHCVHYLTFQSPRQAPVKYVLQALRTLFVLFRDHPDAVHVQNPPFVCGLVVDLYCRLTGARFVIEHHSAAFDPPWGWAERLQRYVCRRATTNIVTSWYWAELIERWGGRSQIMYDAFLELPPGRPYPLGTGFNLAVVSTFAEDEPVEAVLEAARQVPDATFYVTGDPKRLADSLRASAPPNVNFTGFLDMNGEYLGLLRGADAAMVLTTRDHTLQLGGCEAIAVGTPLITSDFAYLRDLFDAGALYAAPDPDSIADAVREMQRRHHDLELAAADLRRRRRDEFTAGIAQLERDVRARRAVPAAV